MSHRVAIIGGGAAGLAAGYFLHPTSDLELFEKSDRLGGNAYTYRARHGEYMDIAVAAFGMSGYPHFYKLLAELGIQTRVSPGALMSVHDLDRQDGLYMTPSWSGLRAQHFGILRPAKLGALYELGRRMREGIRRERAGAFEGLSVAQALEALSPWRDDARHVLMCVFCLLSSMRAAEILEAPASFFFRKIAKHDDVASPRAFYSVRTVSGFTQRYVAALAAPFLHRVHLGARLQSVVREPDRVRIVLADGRTEEFDHVVFGCNADQALALLAAPTEEERRILGAWRYMEGRLVVHRDHRAFPPRELWQAYTFLHTGRGASFDTSVTGVLAREPGVSRACDLLSTQHANFPIQPDKIELETVLRTPIFDRAACAAQPHLPSLNGVKRSYYCGSHFGFGLHEDCITSAQAVAHALGAARQASAA